MKKVEDIRFSSSSIDDFFKPQSTRVATGGKLRVSGIGDLSGFQFLANDKLVRISQKDFWKLGQDSDGYFIERLVSDDDGPIEG